MKTFAEYIKLLERVDDIADQVDANEEDTNEPEDFVKLKRFLFLALAQSHNQILPTFQQIAASDNNGKMADLLHNIDWGALTQYAKETLQKWDSSINQQQIQDDEDDDTQPVRNNPRSAERMDRVKLPTADAGNNDQNGGGE